MNIKTFFSEHRFRISLVAFFALSIFLMMAIAFSFFPEETEEIGYARPGVELVDEEGSKLFDGFGHWLGPTDTIVINDMYTLNIIKGWNKSPLNLGDDVMGEVIMSPRNDAALYYVPKGSFSFGYGVDDPSASPQYVGVKGRRFYSVFWPKDTRYYGSMQFDGDPDNTFYWEVLRDGTVHPSHFFDMMATMPESPQFPDVDK